MGFLPKRITKQNLDNVSVYIEDTDNQYFNVQEVPETLTQGRYAFKLFGSSLLRPNVELRMELLDNSGNTVYLTPVDYIGEEIPPHVPYRYVTIEVYSPPINVGGLATLTILGELNPSVVDVPSEFTNAYNVRYQKTINIDLSTVSNTQPIRFFKNPTTSFKEVVEAKTILSPVSQSTVSVLSSGTPRSDIRDQIIKIESGSLEKEALPHQLSDKFRDLQLFQDEYKYKTGLRGKVPALLTRRGLFNRYASVEQPKFTLKTDTPIFTADMQGGIVEIPERQVTLTDLDVNGNIQETIVTVPKFSSEILEVVNENTIIPFELPLVPLPTNGGSTGTDVENVTVTSFENVPLTASFNVTNTSPSSSTFNFDSLLELTINDMRTFSGDVYRIRVHGKSEAAMSDFTVLTDVIVESPELLVDVNSPSGVLRTGYFLNQSHINTYWNKFSIDGNVKGTNVTTSHTGSHFIDSLHLSGSTYGTNESVVVETTSEKSFSIRKDSVYTLTAKVKGRTTKKLLDNTDVVSMGKLYFHLSGSNLNTSKIESPNTSFGAELTDDATGEPVVLQLDDAITGIQNFETIQHTFKPKFNLDRTINDDTILQIRATSGEWFISDLSLRPAMDTGFSPDQFKLKVPIPRSIRPDRFDFLLEYFDINNNVSETVTVLQNVPISGSALVIDGDGNLLTGSLFMGNALNSGIEAAGVNSAFIRSVGYEGFESASLGGKGGFMIFSGSVLPNAPDEYVGAGIEIHDGTTGVNESYLKFRTNPSEFDVKTSKFFLGGQSQFISGSNGNIEISSSKFHVKPNGDIVVREIQADTGEVGGFTINDGSLTAGTGNSSITMSSSDVLFSMGSGSTFNKSDLQGGFRVGIDTDGVFKFAVGNAASFLYADASGVSIKTDSFDVTASVAEIDVDVFALSSNNLFISSSGGGFISAGNPRPTGIGGTNKGFYVQGNTGTVLIGNANGSHVSFDGSDLMMSSSAFYLGNDSNYISGSGGNIEIFNTGTTTLSGSAVNIQTPKFYLGETGQYISGSDGNIEISSSNFHLDNSGNVTMTGNVTANAGTLGGFVIGGGAISSDNFFISGAAENNQFFISSSNFNVKASGQVTASALQLAGGTAGGLAVSEGQVAVGEILKLKDSGQITGSTVLFTGGKIAGWDLDSSAFFKGSDIVLDANNKKVTINDGTFGNTGIQLDYNNGRPRAFIGNRTGSFIKFENDNLEVSSSTFFLGSDAQFLSGSSGNLEVSSSGFHLTPLGDVTASNILLGSKGLGDFLEFNSGVLTVQGEVFANSINTPATAATPSASISSDGLAKFVSASIGGFEVSSNQINSVNDNLILKSSGQISASAAQITGKITAQTGTIGGFNIGTDLDSTTGTLKLKGATGQLTASAAQITGKVTATSGEVGGFTIDADEIKSTNLLLDSSNEKITVGSSNAVTIQGGGTDNFITMGKTTFGQTTTVGAILGMDATVPTLELFKDANNSFIFNNSGIDIKTDTLVASGSSIRLETPRFYLGESSQFISGSNGNIEISSSNFHLDKNGNVVMSGNVSATTGTIGGFTIGDDLSSTAGTLKLKGASGQLTASAAQISGKITAESGTIGGFNIGTDLVNSGGGIYNLTLKGTTGQITASHAKITGNITAQTGQIAGFTIDGNTLTATNFTLDASGKRISLGSGDNIFIADGDEGIQLGDPVFADAPFSVTKAGVLKSTSGTIGGWSIGNDEITGGSMIIRSDGTIESEGFASDLDGSGFRLTAASGGFLEVQNAKIRGTLSTAVFEKETVNAVGGQLYVANSTVLSGSLGGFVGTSDTTMSVANVGGFVANEILSAKKVNATGFATEYLLVESASRDNPSSNTDFSGKLYVIRGYGAGVTGESGSLGDTPSTAQTYSGSQVIVSTGKVGTGYIRLNANPSDPFTPYIDIVERTGSGIYDVDLKARLGDLSGLSSARLHGANPANQFGLYSKNVFLEGGIVANTGSIGGIEMESGKLYNGVGTHGNSNTGFYVDSGSKFSLGDKLVWDGSTLTVEGAINISGGGAVADQLAALNQETGSIQDTVIELGTVTASLLEHVTALGIATASLQSATGSLQSNIDTVESNVSGAFSSTSASLASDLVDVESNVSGAFSSTSASLASDIVNVETNVSGAFSSTSASIASTIGTISSSTAERIVTDSKGLLLDIPVAPSGEGLYLNYPYLGFYDNSEFTAFISASGGFLFKADDNNLISFGQSTVGGDGQVSKSFILKSDNVFLSGSKVNILGERFFLGGSGQFISGSGGNIEISSSKFHVKPDGDIVVQKVNATEGSIGGFGISSNKISSSVGGLTLNADGGITGSKFLLTGGTITSDVTILGSLSAGSIATGPGGGQITAQITDKGFARFVSASIGGFDVDGSQINSINDNLILKSSGQITASAAKISGDITITAGGAKTVLDAFGDATASLESHVSSLGEATASLQSATASLQSNIDNVESNVSGAFNNTSASLASTIGTTSASIASTIGTISSSTAERIVTDAKGLVLDIPTSPSGEGLYLNYPYLGFYDNSEFTAFISASGGFLFKADDNNLISFGQNTPGGDGTDTKSFVLKSDNVFLSGSKVNILGERFFLGGSGQFVSGSGGNIEISSSKFHVRPDGDVVMNNITASNALISGNITITAGPVSSQLDALNEETASLQSHVTSFGESTASLQSSVTALGVATASLQSATGSLQTNIDNVESNVSGAFTSTSASIASDIDQVETNVSGAFSSVSASIVSTVGTISSSTAERIMTDSKGLVLDIPDSPSGEGLFLNYPYLGFYGKPTITDTTYVVTVSGQYYIDGVQQPTLELQVGYTYRFDTSDGTVGSHPFRFATAADAAGSSQYTTDVTVGSGYVDITVTSSTPSTLYYYCTNHGGMGGQINVVDNSEFKAFISASGGFLFKADDNNLISFGQSVSGGDGADSKSFVLKSDNVFLSGSKVNILGERFFLGGSGQFISGSGGNIEISSSKFHVQSDGDVVMNNITASNANLSGKVTATSGLIGGMSIESNSIESTADAGDGSTTTHVVTANGNSNYIILGQSNPTLTLIPGNTYRFDVSDDTNGGHPFRFTESDGGTDYYTTGVTISGTVGDPGAYVQIAITQSTPSTLYYRCTNHAVMRGTLNIDKTSPLILDGNTGQISGSRVLFEGGKIGGAILTSGSISSGTSGYENDGFFLDSGGKFSLGDKLSWDGSNLSLEGSITITAGTGFATAESVSGSFDTAGTGAAYGAGAVASASAYGEGAVASGSAYGEGAVASGSAYGEGAVASGSLFGAGAVASASAYGEGAVASGSAYAVGAAQSASVVQTNLNTVSSSTAERIVTDSKGQILDIPNAPSGEGLYLNYPYLGFYDNSEFTAFISASGAFLFKADDNNLISFGQNTPGGDGTDTKSFVLKSDNVFLSGSKVNILGERFFLGGSGQFVSGSGGNIEISSSAFHLTKDGNVTMSGSITATSGEIGGFTIGDDLSNSAGETLKLKGSSGQITASAAQITGKITAETGTIGGFNIGTDLDSTSGTLKLKGASGQITASEALINGNITATTINATGSGVIGGFTLSSTEISASGLLLKSSGQITASAADLSGKITAASGQIATFSITSGSIESSANAKRGLKLEPGDSIRGYGNEAHSTTSSPGLFSFGIRTVAPPAGTSRGFTSTTDLLTNDNTSDFATE